MLFCLAVHWLALRMWFFTDDFAWLGLRLQVHSPSDLMHVLFSPQAEGTVRTLSERLYFLVFSSIFGLESPPFRIWALLTQFANIALLMQIARRLTGSAAAGFLAALLWSANAGLAEAISWSSAYNEIAAAFFILLAFRLFLAYIDTGQQKYWIWQWVVFLLGFGALELNVVYPALALGYALCCARLYLRKTLYLFIPSVLFIILHLFFIPKPPGTQYKMYFDTALFTTLWNYWGFALGALRDSKMDWRPLWLGLALTLLITVFLAVFLFRKVRNREWLAVFLPAWFILVLAPVLPLKDHITGYYLTVPVIGLTILGAWAVAAAQKKVSLVAAAILTCLYLAVSITDINVTENFRYDRARRMKYLIKGLESHQRIQAKRIVLLSGIDNDLFWTGFCDDPFRLLGISHVYLTPGSAKDIQQHPEWGCDTSRFFVTVDQSVPMLRGDRAGVFALEGRNVREVTQPYLETAALQVAVRGSDFVDVADPSYQDRLGPSWYPAERDYRWMPKTATVKMQRPNKIGQILEASGYCPASVLAAGPLTVSFRADGVTIGTAAVAQPDQRFNLNLPLPAELVGRQTMELEIEVNRTLRVSKDSREFGLVFTTFTIK
jgi:hypothetical protein